MERPQGSLDAQQTRRLDDIREKAAVMFGEDALFTYGHTNPETHQTEYSTLTLEQAVQICGEHIVDFPDEVALSALKKMNERALKYALIINDDSYSQADRQRVERLFEATRQRGEAVLARRALAVEP